jgi:hypothetical protein
MRTRLSGLTVTPTPPTSCRQAYAIGWSEIEVQKALLSGGSGVTTLATSGAGQNIAVSSTAVFWTVSGNTVAPPSGAVMTVAK